MRKLIAAWGVAATLVSPVQAKDAQPLPWSPLSRELRLAPPGLTRDCIRAASGHESGLIDTPPMRCIRMGKSFNLAFPNIGETVKCYVERRQHSPEEQALVIMVMENDKVVAGVQSTVMESVKATLDGDEFKITAGRPSTRDAYGLRRLMGASRVACSAVNA
jgi:hypothetical protein